jgi:hypothetical protein
MPCTPYGSHAGPRRSSRVMRGTPHARIFQLIGIGWSCAGFIIPDRSNIATFLLRGPRPRR